LSLEHQSVSIEGQYEKTFKGTHQWGGVYSENGVSAYKIAFSKRPCGRQLFSKLQKGDVLIVDKVDRMFRNMRDFVNTVHWLEQKGASIYFIDFMGSSLDQTTFIGNWILNILVLYAELESKMRSKRITDAYSSRRARGKGANIVRWGCDRDADGRVHLTEATCRTSARVAMLHRSGISLSHIREILEEENCKIEGRPYRKSAFHKYALSKDNAARYYHYAILLEQGVSPVVIANMGEAAFRAAVKVSRDATQRSMKEGGGD
jgi:DNA invertase Pin-like site-specific DNA recombinase